MILHPLEELMNLKSQSRYMNKARKVGNLVVIVKVAGPTHR